MFQMARESTNQSWRRDVLVGFGWYSCFLEIFRELCFTIVNMFQTWDDWMASIGTACGFGHLSSIRKNIRRDFPS